MPYVNDLLSLTTFPRPVNGPNCKFRLLDSASGGRLISGRAGVPAKKGVTQMKNQIYIPAQKEPRQASDLLVAVAVVLIVAMILMIGAIVESQAVIQ